MRIRSQIEAFSHEIDECSKNWNGEKSIHFSVPIKEETRQIDSIDQMCSTLDQRITRYIQKDQSLLGKIETLGTLSASLSHISNRAYRLKPWYKKVASFFGFGLSDSERAIKTVKSKVDSHIRRFTHEKALIESGESRILKFFGIKVRDTFLFASDIHGSDPKRQLIKSAFRVVKEIDPVTRQFLDTKFGGASWIDSTKEIRQEFEAFHNSLSPDLQARTAPFLRSLKVAEELAKHISVSAALINLKTKGNSLLSDAQIDRYIRQQSADMAYIIEKAVKALPEGESIVIPGGFTDQEGGHAVATKIKKTENGTCQVACYNTGLGAEEGQGIFGTFAMMITWNVKVPTFEQVPLRTAVKQAMLINLLDLTPKDWQPSIKVRNFMQNAKFPVAETLKDSIRLQTWGTCSFDSIMSYLSHDVPSDLFLLFQLHSMQNAYRNVQAALPVAEKENYFNEVTLELLKSNPTETLKSHKELCQKVFDRFNDQIKQIPRNTEEVKTHLRTLQELKNEQGTYWAPFLSIGRSDLSDLNQKIAPELAILNAIRELITLTAAPSEKAEIKQTSDEELISLLLDSDLSFIQQRIGEMEELHQLFTNFT